MKIISLTSYICELQSAQSVLKLYFDGFVLNTSTAKNKQVIRRFKQIAWTRLFTSAVNMPMRQESTGRHLTIGGLRSVVNTDPWDVSKCHLSHVTFLVQT